jgi:hypothetical protein
MLVPLLLLSMQLKPPVTGSDLYSACQAVVRFTDNQQPSSESEFAKATECLSYVEGFTDGLGYAVKPICIGDATMGTMVRVYVLYMQNHPKLMDAPKQIGVYAALQASYPCPK